MMGFPKCSAVMAEKPSPWAASAEQQLSCGCRLSVKWRDEQIFAVSHGLLTKLFFLSEDGDLIGEVYPDAWVKSVCPAPPRRYDTTDAG